MQRTKMVVKVFALFMCAILVSVGASQADIPAPPANQNMGFSDTIFNNLAEPDCRICHDDPGIAGATPNVDRHHLLYGSALPQGECSINRNACLSDADCDAGICARNGTACTIDEDCPDFDLGETCGEVCVGETAVINIDANQDGANDTSYACLSCHEQDTSGGVTNFLVQRDCLQCHVQVPGEGSVHHLGATAQGLDAPLGDPAIGDCTPCHGTLVDDVGDGHQIPTYAPSLVTPKIIGGAGAPLNSEDNGAGACNYCHATGTGDPTVPGTDNATGIMVYGSAVNHHNTGVFASETGVYNFDACTWCHDLSAPEAEKIRTCEGCHGFESLHNIQVDSDGDCVINVGDELAGYGHIGADNPGAGSDCWGCHGFGMATASAPGAGPTTPTISSPASLALPAGSASVVAMSGSAFTNALGAFQWTSVIVLTAADNSTTEVTPDAIDACSCTVTIPGTLPAGNYSLRAVKSGAVSNPIAVSITPPVEISSTVCSSCSGQLTINGSGFGDAPPEGSEAYINVEADGIPLDTVSWSDSVITVESPGCNVDSVTVNTLFGSASK